MNRKPIADEPYVERTGGAYEVDKAGALKRVEPELKLPEPAEAPAGEPAAPAAEKKGE